MKKECVTAIIWRESIYKNNFKCKCGAKLAEKGQPTDNVVVNAVDSNDNRLFCKKCMNFVAVEKLVPHGKVDAQNNLLGNWQDKVEEYENHFANAEKMVEELKILKREYNRKLGKISELESKVAMLEQRDMNKDEQIKMYSRKLQMLTNKNNELEHIIDDLREKLMFREV